jgi:hypothetical protein
MVGPEGVQPVAAAPAVPARTSSNVVAPTTPAVPAPKVPQQSRSFFKSRTGAIVLAVFAVGTGYAIYSAREDRIRGINR